MTGYMTAVRLRATTVRISPLRIAATNANTLLTHWTIGVGLGLSNFDPLGTQASLGVDRSTVVNERYRLLTSVDIHFRVARHLFSKVKDLFLSPCSQIR